ncbi:SH3 domain-containing protein [Rhizobium sp. L1K21]|uniref:SH3 domain-containing protein n=1 Tax=Rhizobium sp. L1K21 TaxID=2954933 RepID=UPI0020930D72|nr:SH3 domain-containing protein [Rhizobium sp. L1K21]MCO6187768.1 SH3 domain-containing protein [Rhizobium sp. L1K21]
MDRKTIFTLGLGLGLLLPAVAEAASAYATTDVNMRAGPGTNYPVLDVIPDNARVQIFGCMRQRSWCDVAYRGTRGWTSQNYLQVPYQNRRVPVRPRVYRPLGIPNATFSIGPYWDRHYRGRDFYHDRRRWDPRDRGDHRRHCREGRGHCRNNR